MLRVEEALRAVLAEARHLPTERVRVDLALHATLAEDIAADLDSPPFDKSLVDGYAVRSEDFSNSTDRTLRIVDEITAGRNPSKPIAPGECASIMTGAPLPAGTDAVVMHESTERLDSDRILIRDRVSAGLNRLTCGTEMRAGQIVLNRGERIDAIRLGVLASVGRKSVEVHRKPIIRVIPTGDELVEPGEAVGPGQIRNSNALLLTGLIRSAHSRAEAGGIVPDDFETLRQRFGEAIGEREDAVDVLMVSGGVSAGKLDLVPSALEAVGVRPVFHKVRLRPGKPLWFGVGPERSGRPPALIFGLPGNPVSGVVGTLLFVLPALAVLAGRPPRGPVLDQLPLDRPFSHRGERATYHPVRIVGDAGERRIEPLPWAGSPDLLTIARADGFAAFPPGDRSYEAGERVGYLPLPGSERP